MTGRAAAITAFLAAAGWRAAERAPMGADWSTRRYERLRAGPRTAILMDAPEGPPVEQFARIGRWLRAQGLHAPEVLAEDAAAGLLLLEDLGDVSLAQALAAGGDEPDLYALATDAILVAQAAPPPPHLLAMDEGVLLELLELFLEHAAMADPPARERFRAIWRGLLAQVELGPPAFLHRDYHAENLLWLPHAQGLARLGIIDFQDAFRGPRLYDLVSLVQDARRDVAPDAAAGAIARWRRAQPSSADAAFDLAFAVLGAQRALRILGVVARLAAGGRRFPTGLVPRVRGHLAQALGEPRLGALHEWCALHYPESPAGG